MNWLPDWLRCARSSPPRPGNPYVRLGLQGVAFGGFSTLFLASVAIAAPPRISAVSEPPPSYIRESAACPTTVEALTPLLLRDLPSYTNRVVQRLYRSADDSRRAGYVLIASAAQLDPLTLGPGIYAPTDSQPTPGVEQVFFTTVERQYVAGRAVNFQYHHWLFLTQANQQWQVVTMVSQLATLPEGQILSPPEDTGQGTIAQAVRLWLRDCEYGAVDPFVQEHQDRSTQLVQ